jgi:GalNAc-alpha-(1->4)-GalNAc-alpha-(1->3)-diNAcBac-PP-undecaprenol alpha-1,4-N-acetyl-D-galactosaminyltransferase
MISSLGPGGAERVMTLLADALAARGHDVCLLTLADPNGDFFSVGPRVRRVALALSGDSKTTLQAVRNNLCRVRAIRRAVSDNAPEAIISFMTNTNVLAILACSRLPVRVIVSERVDPRGHRVERLWSVLRLLLYRRADALVVQTGEAAAWFRQRLPGRVAVTAIANPVARVGEAPSPTVTRIPRPFILAAGRLVHQKGFDLLITAFAKVTERCPSLRLAIAGEGPDRAALLELATRLGLETRVFLLGRVAALPALMRQAHAFVLSSRYEGFPNVLLEALANGLPVVSTDCPSGPREILLDSQYGLLVSREDPGALAEALVRISTDEDLRQRLSSVGPAAIDRYGVESVVAAWESVLSPGRAESLSSSESR